MPGTIEDLTQYVPWLAEVVGLESGASSENEVAAPVKGLVRSASCADEKDELENGAGVEVDVHELPPITVQMYSAFPFARGTVSSVAAGK